MAFATVRNAGSVEFPGGPTGGSAIGRRCRAGQQTFLADGCWECHGTVAQGGVITGPRLAHTALPYEAVLQQLRVPQNAMPPYEASVVPDAQVADIYAWLQSLPAPQSAANIPLLNQPMHRSPDRSGQELNAAGGERRLRRIIFA